MAAPLCLLLSASIRRAPVLRRQGTQEKINWGDLDWWGSDWQTGVNRASAELPGVLIGSVASETCVVQMDETEEGVARVVMC